MALWQYTFHIIPKDSYLSLGDVGLKKSEDYLFDDSMYWAFSPVSRSTFAPLADILPMNKSWSQNIDLYGEQESHCVEVLHDGNRAESVSIRINHMLSYEVVLLKIILFLRSNNFVIIDEDLNLQELNTHALTDVMEQSKVRRTYMNLIQGKPPDSTK